jgi:glyoxylase-like metal-dependent hydrolase (beta-lactamase superfamily II)
MQEIVQGIYIEESYLGVTLGAISRPHGLILVDAPPRPEDVRSWRSALLNLGGGVERLLVNLDSHIDRTLGARAMECTVVGHEKMSQVFRNRPTTFKAQNTDTGAEWEQIGGVGSIRWGPPEITFDVQMAIHWGEGPILLEYHPGPNPGAIWTVIPDAQVAFIGDTVIPGQPPYLANADLPAWIETLQLLLSDAYHNYTLISGRAGQVTREDVRKQSEYLERVHQLMDEMSARKDPPEATDRLLTELAGKFRAIGERREIYNQRLKWGLSRYYSRHYRATAVEGEE